MRIFLFILLITLFFVSCKKDNTPVPTPHSQTLPQCDPIITFNHSYDTIYPSDYLMAYPGSWWEYDNGFIDSCLAWEEVFIHQTTIIDGCKYVEEDLWILPEKLSYHSGNIAFNQAVNSSQNHESTKFYFIYSDMPGIYHNSVTHYDTYKVTTTLEMFPALDSMVVNGITYYDVIHQKTTSKTGFYKFRGERGPTFTDDYFFAKDVGLISNIKYGTYGLLYELNLVNYYIAPH